MTRAQNQQSENLTRYLAEIEQFPQLSLDQERELTERMQAGDANAREQMIHAHLRLAARIAQQYRQASVDVLDLIQEANMGLLKATEKYESARGRFATYAAWWVKERVIMALSTQSVSTISLDDEESLYVEEIQDTDPTPEEAVELRQITSSLYATFSVLTEQERLTLVYRFGLDGRADYRTLVQVAKHLHVSQERVRQLIDQAFRKIRKSGYSAALHDYWEEHCAS